MPAATLITVDVLRRLVEDSVVESEDLEFKQQLYDQRPPGNQALANDVAALANRSGGVIVLGIEENRSTSAAQRCVGVTLSDGERRRMAQAIRSRVTPFPSFEILSVSGDADLGTGLGFYCILIDRTAQAPHAVVDRDQLRYPVRNGTSTRYLSEPEVANAYADRFSGAATRRTRLDTLWDAATERLNAHQAWVVTALVPAIPGAVSINRRLVETLQSTWPKPWPIDQLGLLMLRTFVRAGMVVGGGGQASDGDLSSYVRYELHADGSALFAHVVGRPPSSHSVGTTSQMITDEEIVTKVVAGIQVVARLATDHAGARAEATVRCGVHAPDRTLLHLLTAGEITGVDWSPPDRERGSMSTPLPVSDLTVQVDELTAPTPQLISTAAVVGSALVQSLGVVELRHLHTDRTIDSRAWNDPASAQVWASSAHLLDSPPP